MGNDPKENPDSWSDETGVQGIEALPKKIDRYGKAKSQALQVAEFIGNNPKHQKVARRLADCGDYLVFRHYYTVDQVKLHGARLCTKHLLCPLCAIRRGSRALKAYLDRWEALQAQKPALKPFLITLTVKDGPDLAERWSHLYRGQMELWKRKQRGRHSALDGVEGAVWSYEVKVGSGSGLWHPHEHMIALAENQPDQEELSAEWKNITGDSHVVDVRPITGDPVEGFMEVFKYAVKFSEQEPAHTAHAWEVLSGKRLLGSSGCFRGVVFPEGLLDDPAELEGLPYFSLFYSYLKDGYNFVGSRSS